MPVGQVSQLEDIQKAHENLEALKGTVSQAPTDAALKAQERRIEKERQRLAGVTVELQQRANQLSYIASADEIKLRQHSLSKLESEIRALESKKFKLEKELSKVRSHIDVNVSRKKIVADNEKLLQFLTIERDENKRLNAELKRLNDLFFAARDKLAK